MIIELSSDWRGKSMSNHRNCVSIKSDVGYLGFVKNKAVGKQAYRFSLHSDVV